MARIEQGIGLAGLQPKPRQQRDEQHGGNGLSPEQPCSGEHKDEPKPDAVRGAGVELIDLAHEGDAAEHPAARHEGQGLRQRRSIRPDAAEVVRRQEEGHLKGGPRSELDPAVKGFPVLRDDQDQAREQQAATQSRQGRADDRAGRSLLQFAAGLPEGALQLGRDEAILTPLPEVTLQQLEVAAHDGVSMDSTLTSDNKGPSARPHGSAAKKGPDPPVDSPPDPLVASAGRPTAAGRRLALQGEHAEDALVDAPQRLAADEALQPLDAQGELAAGPATACAESPRLRRRARFSGRCTPGRR